MANGDDELGNGGGPNTPKTQQCAVYVRVVVSIRIDLYLRNDIPSSIKLVYQVQSKHD